MRPAPLLGPDTLSWRVNREAVLLAGGGRALLLQVAHPSVAAGVEQHSDYQAHPWGRLFRTLDTTYKIVFGDRATSARASARLNGRHARVKGTSDEGRPYHALDPSLLLWVWATLVDTSLLVYERCLAPLSQEERERYYEEQKLFAHACGVPEGSCPQGYGEFRDYYARTVDEELKVTQSARAVARAIEQPRLPRALRPAMAPNTLLTVGLLPERLRAEYGFRWGPDRERLLRLSLGALRLAGRATPRPLRELPADWVATGRLDRVRARVRRTRPRKPPTSPARA